MALLIADLCRSFRESDLHVEAVSQDGQVVLPVVEAVSDYYAISTFTDRFSFRELFAFTAFADDFVSDVVGNFVSLILDVFVQLLHLSHLFEGFILGCVGNPGSDAAIDLVSFRLVMVMELFVQVLHLSHLFDGLSLSLVEVVSEVPLHCLLFNIII